jgi:surface antigen
MRLSRVLVLCLTVGAGVCHSATAVAASPGKVAVRATTVRAEGYTAGVRVRVRGRRLRYCEGTVFGANRQLVLPDAVPRRRRRVGWNWDVPQKAPSGRWRVSIVCVRHGAKLVGADSVSVRTRVDDNGIRLAAKSTMEIGPGTPRGYGEGGSPRRELPEPHYPRGQCTWLAWKLFGDPELSVHMGHASEWAKKAHAAGYPVYASPKVGTIAVWRPGADGAGRFGHVAIVTAILPGGRIVVRESNWDGAQRKRGTVRTTSATGLLFIYHKGDGPPSPPPPEVGPQTHHVYGTSGLGLKVRSAPSRGASEVGHLPEGAEVTVECQTRGERVEESDVWDQIGPGQFVSDWYIDTPAVGEFSPGLPLCS